MKAGCKLFEPQCVDTVNEGAVGLDGRNAVLLCEQCSGGSVPAMLFTRLSFASPILFRVDVQGHGGLMRLLSVGFARMCAMAHVHFVWMNASALC